MGPEAIMALMGLLGGGASALGGLFGKNQTSPMDAANKYYNQIGPQAGKMYDPYIQHGQGIGNTLHNEFEQGITNPGGRINEIGQNFQQSPGFKFALDQALSAAGRGAAAGGMAGSPMHEQENMGVATGLANQDYYNWLEKTMGLYNTNMAGGQNMYNTGFNASKGKSDLISQLLAQQGAMAYENQAAQNKSSNPFAQFAGGIMGALPFIGNMFQNQGQNQQGRMQTR